MNSFFPSCRSSGIRILVSFVPSWSIIRSESPGKSFEKWIFFSSVALSSKSASWGRGISFFLCECWFRNFSWGSEIPREKWWKSFQGELFFSEKDVLQQEAQGELLLFQEGLCWISSETWGREKSWEKYCRLLRFILFEWRRRKISSNAEGIFF